VEEIEKRLQTAGRNLLTARTAERQIRDRAAALAIEAAAAKISHRRIAELLGVDRMTIRKWIKRDEPSQ
jgi:uncharacterized protein YjcR